MKGERSSAFFTETVHDKTLNQGSANTWRRLCACPWRNCYRGLQIKSKTKLVQKRLEPLT